MKRLLIPIMMLLSLVLAATAYATTAYPWSNHAAPYDYLFGNQIDSHQQSQLNDKEQLGGFFYIKYTGSMIDGVPEAIHADCEKTPDDCTIGWKLKGVAVQATLLEKPDSGHPVWCINPDDGPRSPGFSHFHWEGDLDHTAGEEFDNKLYDGYLLKLTAVDQFFFQHHGGFLVTPGIDTETHANIVTDC